MKVKTQSIIEYVLFIGVIVAALSAMQLYGKRGLQAYYKGTSDMFGTQTEMDLSFNDTQTKMFKALKEQPQVKGENTIATSRKQTVKNGRYVSTEVSAMRTDFSGVGVSGIDENTARVASYENYFEPVGGVTDSVIAQRQDYCNVSNVICFEAHFLPDKCGNLLTYRPTDNSADYYAVNQIDCNTALTKEYAEQAVFCVSAKDYSWRIDQLKALIKHAMASRIHVNGFYGNIALGPLLTCSCNNQVFRGKTWIDLGSKGIIKCE